MSKPLNIRKLRTSLKLSQTELAERLGVTAAAVCRWERGQRKVSKTIRILLRQQTKARG